MKIIRKLSNRDRNAGDNPTVVIAFLGDSVTHGCFEVFIDRFGEVDTKCRPDRGYVAKFQQQLYKLFPKAAVSVINAGVSGGTASEGEARIERDVLSHNPDLVVVNFGLNDSLKGMDNIEAYRSAMKNIMKKTIDSGAECILLTPHRMCSYVSPDLSEPILRKIAEEASYAQTNGVADAYVSAAKEEAGSLGVPVADAYAIWTRLEDTGVDTTDLLSNHINHPTEEACNFYVDALLRTIFEIHD